MQESDVPPQLKLFDLTDKVALVTGAARGIGLTIARGLAGAGADVAINDLDRGRVEVALEALEDEGLEAQGIVFDVSDAAAVAAGVSDVERRLGPIHILVNNAGVHFRSPLEDFPEEGWDKIMDTHLRGAFLTARAVAKGMIERRAGKIINICSLTSEVSRPTSAVYATAKGGMKMLTRAMAVEWSRYNVQANGIAPGFFRTELNAPLIADPEFNSWLEARTPAGRWGELDDLVGSAIFLASDASDFVCGQVLTVDGGFLASM